MSHLNPSAFSNSDKLRRPSILSFIISRHKKKNISPRISIIISHSYQVIPVVFSMRNLVLSLKQASLDALFKTTRI